VIVLTTRGTVEPRHLTDARAAMGRAVEAAMRRMDMSPVDVASATGVSVDVVRALEAGAGDPPTSVVIQIAHELGLTVALGRDPADAGVAVVVTDDNV
jgi:ribosome-binding protein aMBF1 (putative translation factor)